jgi:TPR repeat protein
MRWPGSTRSRLRKAVRLKEDGRLKDAFAAYMVLAQAGNAEAAHQVALAYLEGKLVAINRSAASYWLEKAASQGFVPAQTCLAELHLQGLIKPGTSLFDSESDGKPDFIAASKWAQRSAIAGSAAGQALYAYILNRCPELRDLRASRQWYERAAAGGSAQGNFGYALAIIEETGRQKEAAFHLRRAGNIPAAVYLLGVMLEHGIGTTHDPIQGARCYQQAAEAGHANAMGRYGAMLLYGVGAPRNPVIGETLLRRAGLAGDAQAAYEVARLCARDNFTEAAIWFERAALAGHGRAAHLLGLLYLNGTGVVQDQDEALRWFQVAATATVQNDLARLVLKQANDPVSILEWLRTEAEAGDAFAQLNYGICLVKAAGVPCDEAKAIQYFFRASDTIPNARYWYGLMLAEGRGGEVNLPEARQQFSLAAKAGQADAAAALGEMLVNGRGGAIDMEQAIELFEWAAERNSAAACFALGVLCTGQHGVSRDLPASRRWFLKAAAYGHTQASLLAGRFCLQGIGGEPDVIEARHWLKNASDRGNLEARAVLEEFDAK